MITGRVGGRKRPLDTNNENEKTKKPFALTIYFVSTQNRRATE